MSRVSPSSPRQWNATRSPLPASTWRSRQLWETLSLPSENHLKNGGFEASSASVGSSNQSSSSVACFSHQAGGSFAASSCIDVSVTRASLTKASGGSKRSLSSSSSSSRSRVPSSVAMLAFPLLVVGGLPGQRTDRQDGAAEGRVRHDRKGRIPRDDRRDQPEVAAEIDGAGRAVGVADPEHDERDRQEDEHRGDRRGRAQRGDEHVRREDAPRDEVQADRVAGVGRRDLGGVELAHGPERQPEGAVRAERDSAERVARAELPQAGDELGDAAVEQREGEDDGLALVGHEARVEHAEHERRQRERRQAERPGVGDRAGHERDVVRRGRGVDVAVGVGTGAGRADGRGFHTTPPLRERATDRPPPSPAARFRLGARAIPARSVGGRPRSGARHTGCRYVSCSLDAAAGYVRQRTASPAKGGEMADSVTPRAREVDAMREHGRGEPEIDWMAIEREPEFQELVRTRRAFVIPATIFFLAWYMGFIVLTAVASDFMGQRVYQGLTVGYVLALTQFVMVLVLGILYLRKSEQVFDPLAGPATAHNADPPRHGAPGRRAGPGPPVEPVGADRETVR